MTCEICGECFESIHVTHLKKHKLSIEQYQNLYPSSPILNSRLKASRGKASMSRSIYHIYEGKQPDANLFQFLTGTMLGDGSLEKSKLNARYAEGGSNEKYLTWKYEFIKQYFFCTFSERLSSPHTASGKRYKGWWLRTSVHPLLTTWHEQWYAERKILPFELIETHLTNFALSIWFFDDGYLGKSGCYFYTMAFSTQEIDFLLQLLQHKFGLKGKVLFNVNKLPFIRIPKKDTLALLEIVSEFKIPGMEYKCVI